MDVVLHPLQRKVLIKEPGVGDTTLRLKRRTAEEAKRTEPVVKCHIDDAIAAVLLADLDEAARIAAVMVVLLASGERAAMNPGNSISSAHHSGSNRDDLPDHDWSFGLPALVYGLGHHNVQEQAVLRDGRIWLGIHGGNPCLLDELVDLSNGSRVVERLGLASDEGVPVETRDEGPDRVRLRALAPAGAILDLWVPTFRGNGSSKTQVTDWRLGVTDVGEVVEPGRFLTGGVS